MTFMVGFGPLLVFLSSFVNKKSFWKLTKLDIVCAVVSMMALILWIITGSGVLAITLSIVADLVAGIPTLVKAYKFPESEGSSWVYIFGAISAVITLLAIPRFEFLYWAFPVYIFVICAVIAILIKFPKLRIKNS